MLASIKHEIEALGFTGPILIKISPDEQLNVLENIIQEVKRFNKLKVKKTNSSFKIIGIRPGEKLHEQMISSEDAPHTYEYKDYYYPSFYHSCCY